MGIAVYVTYDAVLKLIGLGEPPERSPVGIAVVALSVVVMPRLGWAKRRVAAAVGSVAELDVTLTAVRA
jgi:divalent metal cation (Fe/Co/Zn/Cd) transporter